MKLIRTLLAAGALLIAGALHAQTATVSGVKYEDSLDLRGTKLQLNGAGDEQRAGGQQGANQFHGMSPILK